MCVKGKETNLLVLRFKELIESRLPDPSGFTNQLAKNLAGSFSLLKSKFKVSLQRSGFHHGLFIHYVSLFFVLVHPFICLTHSPPPLPLLVPTDPLPQLASPSTF